MLDRQAKSVLVNTVRILTGKTHPPGKLKCPRKVRIWILVQLVH